MPFLNSDCFSQKKTWCHVVVAKSLFLQKWRGKIHLEKILFADLKLNFEKASAHAFVRSDRTTGRGNSEIWLLRVDRGLLYDSILPVRARLTMNISRISFSLAKSCRYLYFNF